MATVKEVKEVKEACNEAIGRLEVLLGQHAQYQEELAEVQRRLCLLAVRLEEVYRGWWLSEVP